MRMMRASRTPLVIPNKDKLPPRHRQKPKPSSSKGKPSSSSPSSARCSNSSSNLKRGLDSVKLNLSSVPKRVQLNLSSSRERLCRGNSSSSKSQRKANTMMKTPTTTLRYLLLREILKTELRQESARFARPKRRRKCVNFRSKRRSKGLRRMRKDVNYSSKKPRLMQTIGRSCWWISRGSPIQLPID